MSDQGHEPQSGDPLGWIDGAPSESVGPRNANAVGVQLAVHGLLARRYEEPDAAERRIAAALQRFGRERLARRDLPGRRIAWAPAGRFRWLAFPATALSTAAMLLLLLFWSTTPALTAEAAIQQVIAAIETPVTRVYDIAVRYRRRGFAIDRRVELYSQSTDRFVVVFKDSPVQPAVAGAQGDQQWLVFGESRWSSEDGEESLGAMRARRVLARQLTVHALLVELPDSYDLQLLDAEPLPGSPELQCRPVRATAKPGRPTRARSIVVWPHPETGVVQRLEVEFGAVGRRRVESLTAVIRGEADLPPSFFEAEAHTKPRA